MATFLLGNVSLFVGVLLVVLVIAVRTLARDTQLREDLKAAVGSFIVFLGFKALLLPFDPGVPPHPLYKAVVVAWMLAFAYGLVRLAVSLSLWGYRRFTGKHTTKIVRDVLHFSLYLAAVIPILRAQLQIDLTSLLATSAILSVVIGLALQDTLGNLFAGLSLQLERPFEVGDFIAVGSYIGRVQQTGWRSTRIETTKLEVVTLTNNMLAREAVRNFTRGGQPVGIDLFFGAAYSAPPNEVRREALAAIAEVPLILQAPKPTCRTVGWEDSAIKYQLRCFISDYATELDLLDELYTRLWYRFSRAGIEIPFPQRVIHTRGPPAEPGSAWVPLLDQVDLFKPFPEADRRSIARAARERHFGSGERVVAEGEEGNTFYLVTRGLVSVSSKQAGGEVARLGAGEYFGEMSLLTGAPRAATVTAVQDALLLEFDRAAFASHFAAHPELARLLSELLARRQAQLEAARSSAVTEIGGLPDQGRIFDRLKQIFALRS